jgi:DNA polymerase III epsilon subunit-like protein
MVRYADFSMDHYRLGYALQNACKHFDIEPGVHRALADAQAARQVLLALASLD